MNAKTSKALRRALTCAGTCLAVGAVAACLGMSAGAQADEGVDYSEMFPLEYASSQMTDEKENGWVVGHDVSSLRDVCEAPVPRDNNGSAMPAEDGTYHINAYAYDEESGQYVIVPLSDDELAGMGLYVGCLSCKTSHFTDLYDQMGAPAYGAVYAAESRALVDSDYWDCAMCHDGTPSADNVGAQMIYWEALGGELAETVEPGNAVCGQCHNSFDYRSRIKTEEDLQTFDPYRYGYDIESMIDVCLEDGTNCSTDPETGITESYLLHPEIEVYMETTMAQMGVTCADCHMPSVVDEESGVEYTSHFAAGSPLEKEESLEYCLTCHEAQGIASTEDMLAFVEGEQAEMADAMDALIDGCATTRAALEEAIAAGTLDESVLDEARALYARATFYRQILIDGGLEVPGSRVAMVDWESVFSKGEACLAQCNELIG